MADVELLIRVPEEDYIKISNSNPSYADDFNLYYAIKNSTILPKGHGRIGDLDRLYNVFERNVVSADAFKELFDIAPTIIEADKAEIEVNA